jgi:hypothetical protein
VAKRVLVVGYPKSGTTWLTRLVAELLNAPVRGFWKEPWREEIAQEGSERVSDIEVYKGHQLFRNVRHEFRLSDIVYVVRDVRDVAISGANYFSFRPKAQLSRVMNSARRLMESEAQRIDRRIRLMIHALSEGDAAVSPWCAPAWDAHVQSYIGANVFFVRYEDVLAAPRDACQRLVEHLGVVCSWSEIQRAIQAQSFENVKRRVRAQGDVKRAELLREGRSGGWRDRLTEEQRVFCEARFASTLSALGYAGALQSDLSNNELKAVSL